MTSLWWEQPFFNNTWANHICSFSNVAKQTVYRANGSCQEVRRVLIDGKSNDVLAYADECDFFAGGVDASDETISDAIAREVKEETGLSVAWVIQEIIHHRASFSLGRRGVALKLTFVVEIEEIEAMASGVVQPESGGDGPTTSDHQDTAPISQETLQQALRTVPVKLNDEEHQRYLWVTEDNITAKAAHGEHLAFVSTDQVRVMLEAFELQKHIVEAKAVA